MNIYIYIEYVYKKALERMNLLKVEVLERKVYFNDSRCFDSGPQNILLRWLIVFGS